jgi:hypothetical protein
MFAPHAAVPADGFHLERPKRARHRQVNRAGPETTRKIAVVDIQ